MPRPRWADIEQTRILIFDSVYDAYKGVICYVRVFSGSIRSGDTVMLMSDGTKLQIKEVGRFSPKMKPEKTLGPGNVGYIVTNIKSVSDVKIGDTITSSHKTPAKNMLPGFKEVRPMVFSGVYPIDTSDYPKLDNEHGKAPIE
jgi:GTP-binding protein LepA